MSEKKLAFFRDARDSYSGREYQSDVQDIVHGLIDTSFQLFYKCIWGQDHIPTLDIDSSEEYATASKILEASQVPYVTIKSSPGRFWILVDRLESHFPHAADVVRGLPCDPKYINLCNNRKMYSLRAGLKHGHLPSIIKPKAKVNFSPEFMEFVNAINDFYNSEYGSMMRAWLQYQAAKSKAIEFMESSVKHKSASIFDAAEEYKEEDVTWDVI